MFAKAWYYTKNLKSYFEPSCIVLAYHRVVDLPNDPELLAVSPNKFNSQIAFLKANYKILSLQQLVGCLKGKSIPKNSVVITFDDGYADNLHNASAILTNHKAHATIFITSAMINAKKEFWWDTLEEIFLSDDSCFGKCLQVEIKGVYYEWCISDAGVAKDVYSQLQPLIKSLPIDIRNAKIDELLAWSGKQNSQRSSHAILSTAELRELGRSEFIEIGAHTANHPRLSNETDEVQALEISKSKRDLEKLICKDVMSFSYPFGSKEDFSETSVLMTRKAGYSCAVANIQEPVTKKTHLYKIPRMLVRNWDVAEFELHLKTFTRKPENWIDFLNQKLRSITSESRTYKHV